MIRYIKKIKENIIENNYNSGEELEYEFYNSINVVWDKLGELYTDDLTELYKLEEFMMDEIILRHNEEESAINRKLFDENISIRDIQNNLEDGKRAYNIYSLNNQDTNYFIIGDIHSDSISLDNILEKTDFFNNIVQKENFKLVFLGDYVDRGKAQLKAIQYILSLKYLFPDNVILLRGNHDGGSYENGEIKLWVRTGEDDPAEKWFLLYLDKLSDINKTFPKSFVDKMIKFFDNLANLAFIKKNNIIYLLSHGGIPRYKDTRGKYYAHINSISDLSNVNIVDILEKTIVQNMLWSDPALEGDELRVDNGRFNFTEEHFTEFRERIDFDNFIRGHQVKEDGFETIYNNRFTTIFSSGSIYNGEGNINNETAYERVDPKIISIGESGVINIVDLNN